MLKKVFVSVAVLSTMLAGAATSGQPLSASGAGQHGRKHGDGHEYFLQHDAISFGK